MLVLAAVNTVLQGRLNRAAGPGFELCTVESWHGAIEAMLSSPIELAVVDPALERDPRTHEIERFRILFPSAPVILYTKMTEALAPLLLRLGHIGVDRLMLAWHDDYPENVHHILLTESARAVSRQLFADVQDLFARCPTRVRWAIETITREPAEVQTVNQLAHRVGIDRRTCLRWFSNAGLPSPRLVLTSIRVLYAHRLLQDPGYTIDNVARKLGYAQTRSLAQAVREVFDMPPGEMRVSLDAEQAVRIVSEQLFASAEHIAPQRNQAR